MSHVLLAGPEPLVRAVQIVQNTEHSVALVKLQMVKVMSLKVMCWLKLNLCFSQDLPQVMEGRGDGSLNENSELK